MKWFNIKIKNFVFLLLIVLASCSKSTERSSRTDTLPYYNDASFTPHWLSPKSDSLHQFHRISSFQLINQEGDTITEKNLNDKIYITNFFFTICPGICPKMTANMGMLQKVFLEDDEILLLSHSVTPERDSVPVLKNYAEAKDVNAKRWYLLTGERKQIYDLGRSNYFVEENLGLEKTEDDFLHTENFVLIDKKKHIRGIYNGLNKTSVRQLIADVKTLKKEL